ncbi:sensor histidine kinase [Deinococcus radiophilus]|uniref:histidine kinase n=1 Tax=Deinococcus radiophilus TaxID=32062 RepID=A0A431W4A2_9DEIO|nr:ATP-binding protein [Deinococcus radiophilus]RTR30257.1 histidine kinase [Deinococcus radiophilus]UFA49950.1 histidine kinase [Deinococcus radiophilus]
MTAEFERGETAPPRLEDRSSGQGSSAPAWLDALPQAVLLYRQERTELGEQLVVTGLNRAASELWGIPESRAVGRPLLEVVRRHTLEALAERGGELELEAGGRALRCEARLEGQGGTLILEDLSEHRRREAELREATAVLSHEFRTPVTAIRGVLEALEYDMPRELQQNFVAQGLQETERLARLVEDLAVGFRPTRARTLTLSEAFERAERLLDTEYDLGRPTKGAKRQATKRGAAPRRRVQLVFGEDHLVRADPDKLLQVLLNLIENAFKYGPEGALVEVATSAQNAWTEVAVLDQGDPISDTEGLFRAHTRGRHVSGQGSGMGLYIVRSIVQGWGGQAWAERRGDRNAFCFTVPGVG